jgi:hypothetical protein
MTDTGSTSSSGVAPCACPVLWAAAPRPLMLALAVASTSNLDLKNTAAPTPQTSSSAAAAPAPTPTPAPALAPPTESTTQLNQHPPTDQPASAATASAIDSHTSAAASSDVASDGVGPVARRTRSQYMFKGPVINRCKGQILIGAHLTCKQGKGWDADSGQRLTFRKGLHNPAGAVVAYSFVHHKYQSKSSGEWQVLVQSNTGDLHPFPASHVTEVGEMDPKWDAAAAQRLVTAWARNQEVTPLLCCVVLCCAVLCCAVLCRAVLRCVCCAVLCCVSLVRVVQEAAATPKTVCPAIPQLSYICQRSHALC